MENENIHLEFSELEESTTYNIDNLLSSFYSDNDDDDILDCILTLTDSMDEYESLTVKQLLRIQEYYNSFNTLQIYSHYKLSFPNKFTRFLVSGNYLLKIVNEAKEVVFSRKFVIYED